MAKSNGRAVSARPARVKTAVVISPEAFQRLGAACLKENKTQSEIVEWMINRTLSGYVVSVRGQRIFDGSGASMGSTGSACDVSEAEPTAA